MPVNEIVGAVTVLVAVATYGPYLYDTIRGKVTPHPFSWTIWVTLTLIAYLAQLSDNAGPGAWMNGVVVCICLFIIFFSFKDGFSHLNIRKFDIAIFSLGVAAIPLWLLTDDPLYSVILITFANTIAYIPTFTKSFDKPYEEVLYLYGVNFFRHGASLLALANVSWVTALFPAALAVNNGALALFLLWRRYALARVKRELQ